MIETSINAIIEPFIARIEPIKKIAADPFKKVSELYKALVKKIQTLSDNLLKKKESSLDDYIKIKCHYVSKKLLLILLFLLAAGVISLVKIVPGFLSKDIVLREGSIAAAEFSGKAKLLDENGALLYKGTFADGKYDGKGKLYKNSAPVYDGGFADNKYSGSGREFYPSGKIKYDGEYENGQYNGLGTFYYDNGKNTVKYTGDYKNGGSNGQGKSYDLQNALVYEGEYHDGEFWGKGIKYFPDRTPEYSGGFEKGAYSGEGTEYYSSGIPKYKGSFTDGKYDGSGVLFDENNILIYKGSFKADKFCGEGMLFYTNGNVKYAGLFERSVYNGAGKLFDGSGNPVYEGNFANNGFEGLGTLFSPTEGILYKGFFNDNERFYPGFLSLSDSKLKEILGDPSAGATSAGQSPDSVQVTTAGINIGLATINAALTVPVDAEVPHSRDMSSRDLGYKTASSVEYPYNDYSMSLVLEAASDKPKKLFVTAVKLWGDQALSGISLNMSRQEIVKVLGAPLDSEETEEAYIFSMSYLQDGYLLKLYYNAMDDSIVFLEILNAPSPK